MFCSWGDDITPPQQALGWILDLYDHEDEIVAAGQTIVYCLHQSIGHLGIFVSGKVATKEHGEFAQAMDLIDVMPPGLYEAVITGVDETTEHRDLVGGDYLFTLEKRTLDDDPGAGRQQPRGRAAFRRGGQGFRNQQGPLPELHQPDGGIWRRPNRAPPLLRAMHPNRLRFQMFADANPLMAPVSFLGRAGARQPPSNRCRQPVSGRERMMWTGSPEGLESWGKARDSVVEEIFLRSFTVRPGCRP